jgi:hypothetical protein
MNFINKFTKKIYTNRNLIEICPFKAELFHLDGGTDGQIFRS